VEVIVKEEVRKVSSAVFTGLIRTGIGPFTSNSLDKAFGFAISLRAIGFGKEMFDPKLLAGSSEVTRAVGSATIRKHALSGNPVSLVEGDGLMQRGDDACDLLVRQQTGKSQPAVVINSDVQAFDPGTAIAQGSISGGTHAGPCETAQFLDVEVKKFAGRSTLVALDRWFRRFERGEPMQAVAPQDAGDRGLGDFEHREDLRIGATLPAQSQDVSFEPGGSSARLALWDRGAVRKLGREPGFTGALKPPTDGSLTDVIRCGHGTKGKVLKKKMRNHFSSHLWSKSGISVHVVRAGFAEVEFSSTTSLPEPSRADNVLKHDTS